MHVKLNTPYDTKLIIPQNYIDHLVVNYEINFVSWVNVNLLPKDTLVPQNT